MKQLDAAFHVRVGQTAHIVFLAPQHGVVVQGTQLLHQHPPAARKKIDLARTVIEQIGRSERKPFDLIAEKWTKTSSPV